MRFMPNGVADAERARRVLERIVELYDELGYSFLAVEERAGGAYLGQTGLLHWDDVDERPDIEVAYMLSPEHWGHGYATEAARACRDWAFRNLDCHRVVSYIAVENEPSIAVAQRNGMTRTKRLENNRFGRPIYVYAITREQWLEGTSSL
jgi:RimJ/RimL family protein N-acetyltransferase